MHKFNANNQKYSAQIPVTPPSVSDAAFGRIVKVIDEYSTALLFGMLLSGYLIIYVMKLPDRLAKIEDLLDDLQRECERGFDTIRRKKDGD